MTATEELRRMLDKRGVEYDTSEDDTTIFYDVDGNRYTYNVNPESGWAQLYGYNLTPTQAIAATLDVGMCHNDSEYPSSFFVCSECGCAHKRNRAYVDLPNFCPNCGRRIEVEP